MPSHLISSILLFLAIALGIVFPQGYIFSAAIKYIVMGMLFFAFLDSDFRLRSSFSIQILCILTSMFLFAFFLFFAIKPFDSELALVGFMLAVSPTATAAPVVIKFLEKNIEYVTYLVLVSNSVAALAIPILVPFIVKQEIQIPAQELFLSISLVVYIPLALSQIVKTVFPSRLKDFLLNLTVFPFVLWIALLYLATSKSTNYIFHESNSSLSFVIETFVIALFVCVVNFSAGRLIGGATFFREASQSLGQKNTAFTIWICLNTFNPSIAIGPMFYIIFQNLYNSFLISRFERKSDDLS